jgi:DNA (cytosine-5)-methyltransferase 1
MNELALFAGAGGGILGGHLLGWRTVCAVEWEPYPASVLLARQNDGMLPPFPVWDDVQTFDGRPWRGIVDVVSGGFPCQDISAAGKGAGIDGERSGMWREMARIIHEVRPRFVFVENSPMLTSRGLGTVLGDLASMGFDAEWGVLGAADVGAPHQRDRIWIVANSRHGRRGNERIVKTGQKSSKQWAANSNQIGGSSQQSQALAKNDESQMGYSGSESSGGHARTIFGKETQNSRERKFDGNFVNRPSNASDSGRNGHGRAWVIEPNVGRVADGVAARVDRLKAIGNGQVSEVARRAWEVLSGL